MKLTLKNTLAITGAILLVAFILASAIISQQTKTAFGSTSRGSEYQSYIASSTNASATAGTVVKTGDGTLGSVIITSIGTTGFIRIWDATSTATSTYQQGSDIYSTTTTYGRLVARFRPTATEGTYTFDANLFKGLVIEATTGFDGIVTVTYR